MKFSLPAFLVIASSVGLLFTASSLADQPIVGKVLIKAVSGEVNYSNDGKTWRSLNTGTCLDRGDTIKTGDNATVDLILQYSGTVLRLTPNSALRLARLDQQQAGEDVITETSLRLISGSLVGSQRKLHVPSQFVIVMSDGVATIVGTEYVVRADGAVSVLEGSVSVNYSLPGNGGSIRVTVPEGNSFDPATGQVVPTTPEYLQNVQAHIETVRNNAEVFKAGRATVVVRPGHVSPTQPEHSDNGVGNGIDPQPPGQPPVNDGPGTSPGNPGNRGG